MVNKIVRQLENLHILPVYDLAVSQPEPGVIRFDYPESGYELFDETALEELLNSIPGWTGGSIGFQGYLAAFVDCLEDAMIR